MSNTELWNPNTSALIAQYIQETIELAVENAVSGKGGPFAAIVVKNGSILSRGTNLVTSTNDPTAHAEIVAIREACRVLGTYQLSGCEVFASCEPCPMCLGALYWARPAIIYFAATKDDAAAAGFDDSFIYRELSSAVDKRKIPTVRLSTGESLKPFLAWQKFERRTEY